MKKLTLLLVIPLTIIAFTFLTPYSIVEVEDVDNLFVLGYPFIYEAPAFHTSMASQFFILPLLADLLIYFTVLYIIIALINRVRKINLPKFISIPLLTTSYLLLTLKLLTVSISARENTYTLNPWFEMKVLSTHIGFPPATVSKLSPENQ
ncbi:hypothetical protein ABS768_13300 [Flavobacterium sp. ST-75]|uniref:DUF4293 family protein n=1 Tax=Flavobacterium rhizophilum TaxID=3163296 RepID=A0ABW8YGY1_9FLAO